MKIIVRLNKQYDADLIYLKQNPSFSLPKSIKSVLYSYVRGVDYELNVKDEKFDFCIKPCQFHICLSDADDKDVIDFINNISKGNRNNVIKNIFRNYLPYPIITPYYANNTNIKSVSKTPISHKESLNSHSQSTFIKEISHTPQPEPMQTENVNENEPSFDLFGEFDNLMGDI